VCTAGCGESHCATICKVGHLQSPYFHRGMEKWQSVTPDGLMTHHLMRDQCRLDEGNGVARS